MFYLVNTVLLTTLPPKIEITEGCLVDHPITLVWMWLTEHNMKYGRCQIEGNLLEYKN